MAPRLASAKFIGCQRPDVNPHDRISTEYATALGSAECVYGADLVEQEA